MPESSDFIFGRTKLGHEVRKLFSGITGEKRVAVAYIGNNAVQCLGGAKAVRGTSIYCWPQAASTSPRGVEALKKAGARVFFVQNLHAKVYWTARNGAIVGSGNLSDSGTFEAGLKVDSRAIDLKFWAALESGKLSKAAYALAMQELLLGWATKRGWKGGQGGVRLKPKEWFEQEHPHPVMVAGFTEDLDLDKSPKIKSRLKDSGEPQKLYGYFSSYTKIPAGTWILDIDWINTKRPRVSWMFCDGSISLGRGEWFTFQRHKRSDYPFSIARVREKVLRKIEGMRKSAVERLGPKQLTFKGGKKLGLL